MKIELEISVPSFLERSSYVESLEPEKKKEFLGKASNIHRSEAFGLIIDEMMNQYLCESVMKSVDAKGFDARSCVNALQVLRDRFKGMDAEYVALTTDDTNYDKQEIL